MDPALGNWPITRVGEQGRWASGRFSSPRDYAIMKGDHLSPPMHSALLPLAAAALYLVAALWIGLAWFRRTPTGPRLQAAALGLGGGALALHGLLLYQTLPTATGLDLGVTHAASLLTALVVALTWLATLFRPVLNLGIVLMPLAALAIALEALVPSHHLLREGAPPGLQAHVALSLLAYGLFTIAAIQALMLALADHRLRHHRPAGIMHFLPPLDTIEVLLFQCLTVAFALLTLGLGTGFLFVEDLLGQHLAHKTVLSSFAWGVFAVLLYGRYRFGWRGRRAVHLTLGGFALLMLAYFGSKVVLELILHRV
jgi:ABC-type uncharacterized transport system permease subunit